MSGVLRVLRAAFLTVLAGLLVLSVVPVLVGWVPTLVTSDSMAPGIRAGDVVAIAPVDPAALRPGMVLLMDNPAVPGHLLLHRLVAVNQDGTLTTKGDANENSDSTPVPTYLVKGVGRLRIPGLGLPVVWARNGSALPLMATAVALIAIVLWRPRGGQRAVMPNSSTHCQTGRSAASGSR